MVQLSHVTGSHNAAEGHAPDCIRFAGTGVSALLVLLGIVGFCLEAIGTGYGAEAQSIGIFNTSAPANLLHMVVGAAGLALVGRGSVHARRFLLVAGGIYLVLADVEAFLASSESPTLIVTNSGTGVTHLPHVAWTLHLAVGTVLIVAGLVAAARIRTAYRSGQASRTGAHGTQLSAR